MPILFFILLLILCFISPMFFSKKILGNRDTEKTDIGDDRDIIQSKFYVFKDKKLFVNIGSLKWTTPEKTANMIRDKILGLFHWDKKDKNEKEKRIRMLNMTGNCGGDTFPFIIPEVSGRVYEYDSFIYEILKKNMSQFENNFWEVINGDSTLDSDSWDVIFCDPPFGPEYSLNKNYVPKIGSLDLWDVVNNLESEYFVFKLPRKNFDNEKFRAGIKKKILMYEYLTNEDLNKGLGQEVHKISMVILRVKG